MPIGASKTGMFVSSGAVRKCSSIATSAGSELVEALHADGDRDQRPIADLANSGRPPSPRTRTCWPGRSTRPRPPIGGQCHEVPGDGWLAQRAHQPVARRIALVSVSWVVNVFEATMNSAVSGRNPSASRRHCACRPRSDESRTSGRRSRASASVTITGPSCGAADADVVDVGVARPVAPRQAPLRTPSENRRICSRTITAGITSCRPCGSASPACCAGAGTARPSVSLIFSPANIRSRHSSTRAAQAECTQQAERFLRDRFFRIVEQHLAQPHGSGESGRDRGRTASPMFDRGLPERAPRRLPGRRAADLRHEHPLPCS